MAHAATSHGGPPGARASCARDPGAVDRSLTLHPRDKSTSLLLLSPHIQQPCYEFKILQAVRQKRKRPWVQAKVPTTCVWQGSAKPAALRPLESAARMQSAGAGVGATRGNWARVRAGGGHPAKVHGLGSKLPEGSAEHAREGGDGKRALGGARGGCRCPPEPGGPDVERGRSAGKRWEGEVRCTRTPGRTRCPRAVQGGGRPPAGHAVGRCAAWVGPRRREGGQACRLLQGRRVRCALTCHRSLATRLCSTHITPAWPPCGPAFTRDHGRCVAAARRPRGAFQVLGCAAS
jgi:hypothetical protein